MTLKILLIDDKPEQVANAFRLAVAQCTNGSIFFRNVTPESKIIKSLDSDVIAAFCPDIAVVDIDLASSREGTAFFELKERIPALSDVKVIMFTGYTDSPEDPIEKGIRLGAFSYVRKDHINERAQRSMLAIELERAVKQIQKEKIKTLVGGYYSQPHISKFFESDSNVQNIIDPKYVNKAILFCDIANSSAYVQLLSIPKRVIFFRSLFDWWSDLIINNHGGWIDKFIGDEVNAYFGSSFQSEPPALNEMITNCRDAAEAALDIRDGFNTFFEALAEGQHALGFEQFDKIPLGVKILLHNENVLWGIFGSHKMIDLSILTSPLIESARLMRSTAFLNCYKKMQRDLITNLDFHRTTGTPDSLKRSGLICVTLEVKQRLDETGEFLFSQESLAANDCPDIAPRKLWILEGKI